MNPVGSASAELRQLLTVAPPSLLEQQQQRQQQQPLDPITVAHAALQTLRDSGDEKLLFLCTILEITSPPNTDSSNSISANEELLFHCITGCRHVMLLHWKLQRFTPYFLERTRDYFMALGNALSSSRVCRLACYTTAAAFWKRGWFMTDEERRLGGTAPGSASIPVSEQDLLTSMATINPALVNSKAKLFAYLDAMVQQRHLQQVALFVDCFVSEFGTKSAVTYRMPREFHKATHKAFEKDGPLLSCIRLAVSSLSQVMASIAAGSGQQFDVDTCIPVAHALTTVLGWEFGSAAWDAASATTTSSLIRPPAEWKDYVGRSDLVHTIFSIHATVQSAASTIGDAKAHILAQHLRQVLLQLASLAGPIHAQLADQQQFASCLCEGTLQLLQNMLHSTTTMTNEESPVLPFAFQMISRIVANFRFSLLVELPTCTPLLQCLNTVGSALLVEHARECEESSGNIEDMAHYDWRNESITLLLDAAVLLCGDTWLWYGGTETSRQNARLTLSTLMGPLYESFVNCRTRVAILEEHYHITNDTDLDEVREGITEKEFQDDMEYIATIGRLNPSAAIACLSSHFGATSSKLLALWNSNAAITPDASALLEEARLLTIYIAYLLTDENEGESPCMPEAILITSREQDSVVTEIAAAIGTVMQLADAQVQAVGRNPATETLSPLLAKEFLTFLVRWVPVYVYPVEYGSSNVGNRLLAEWSSSERANQIIGFCTSLCLNYQSFWPQEPQVQEAAAKLLMALAKRHGAMRSAMVATPSFISMVRGHYLTMGVRQGSSQSEFEASIRTKLGDLSLVNLAMLWGSRRLPHRDKGRVFTATLVACSDASNGAATGMLNDSLSALHEAFVSLETALSVQRINPDNIDAREMAGLCVEMFCGVAQAIEMADCERIPQFVSKYLLQLSGWMTSYAKDLTIGTLLLRFFRDYTTNFIAVLDNEQSVALFQACAQLLKRYSEIHCASRVIRNKSTAEATAVEEQTYDDIMFAIQLLIQLGTKDFIDACSSSTSIVGAADVAAGTVPITDVIFFGLQQILPLMTQGLLQFPTLCSLFFELVGFMMDTYPEKVGLLPLELFDSLLESLLFGMSHQDSNVAKCSLQGLASLTREHLNSGILTAHLEQRPDMMDICSKRLLAEVVVQPLIVDRVEAAGMALLPLAACNVERFSAVVTAMASQVSDPHQQTRLIAAFAKLMQPEVLAKVNATGYEGRANRVRFKKDFEEFVNDVNAFLVLR